MANWKVDIGEGSQAYGQSLLAGSQKKRRKRQKRARRAKWAVFGLGLGDMVMQKKAENRLKHITDNNTLAKAVAVANYKQASLFYENQVKKMIEDGVNVDDVREGGQVHDWFRNERTKVIDEDKHLTSTLTNASATLSDQISERATLESLSNLKNYRKKYSKYGRYIPEGLLVDQTTIEAPYDRIVVDATRRLAAPENTSVIRKILSKFDIGTSMQNSLFDIEVDGETIKVSKETQDAFKNRIQMNSDQQGEVDQLIADAADKYGGISKFDLKRIITEEPDVSAMKKTYQIPAKWVDLKILDTKAMGVLDDDDSWTANGYLKEITTPLELNTNYIVGMIDAKELGITDKTGNALSIAQQKLVFENLTQTEMSNFRTSVFKDMTELYQKTYNDMLSDPNRLTKPIVDISDEMARAAIEKTIRENFTFTPEEGDTRFFNVGALPKNDIYTPAFEVVSDAQVNFSRMSKIEQEQLLVDKANLIKNKKEGGDVEGAKLLAADMPQILNLLKNKIDTGASRKEIDGMTTRMEELRPGDLEEWYNVLENYTPSIEEIEVTATKRPIAKEETKEDTEEKTLEEQMDEVIGDHTTPDDWWTTHTGPAPKVYGISGNGLNYIVNIGNGAVPIKGYEDKWGKPAISKETKTVPIKEIKVTAKKKRKKKKKRVKETQAEGKARRKREKEARKAREKEIMGDVSLLAKRLPGVVLDSIDTQKVKKLEKAITTNKYGAVGSLIKEYTGTSYRKLSDEERKTAVQAIIDDLVKGE
tara:strand:- start:188 stop:2470 length:2283 start_codon:yes stop_codon:yes gene_type:complete